MKCYEILLTAVVMQMCPGATCSRSVYAAPVKSTTGMFQNSVQLLLSDFYLVFPATTVVTGPLGRLIRGPQFFSRLEE